MTRAHDRHDRFLVAALAAGDLDGGERREAEALVGDCTECAELLADLRAIAAATAVLPDVPRTIDFRLTERDATRLGARGWRRALQAIADSRFGLGRPLAVGLTTLGLVGLITTSIPGALGGAGGAATGGATTSQADRNAYGPAASNATEAAGGTGQPVPGPQSGPLDSSGQTVFGTKASPSPSSGTGAVAGVSGPTGSPAPSPKASGAPEAQAAGDANAGNRLASSPAGAGAGLSPIVVLSTVALLIGLAVIVAQWAAARFVGG